MKHMITRILAVLTLLATLCLSAAPALAANVCTTVTGTMQHSVTFTISTDKNFFTSNKITFTQTKGFANLERGGTKAYGIFYITVKGGGKTITKTMDDGSCTIRGLRGNTTYTVTVTPASNKTISKEHWFKRFFAGDVTGWRTQPRWTIKKTSGLTLCE